MEKHDNFIVDCDLKTRQILHATTAKQRLHSQRISTQDDLPTPTKITSPLMKPASPFERTVPRKNKPMRSPKTAASLINRRPIEHDFYKMRNASTKRQKYPTKDNETPPL
eukprot:scaffold8633_cov130-Skeletonema_dohrnii-CCMP3373.AAC.6